MNILSIQSHVSYGYVGNKAATFPLQALGFEVWPVNTVQFSNHTGYGHWQGNICTAKQIRAIIQGLIDLDHAKQCDAILSGYLGDKEIGAVIVDTVRQFQRVNPQLIYLCDPVMATPNGKACFVKPDIPDFFRTECLDVANIITPNHFETEYLYGKKINTLHELKQAANFFHQKGIRIVVITSLNLKKENNLMDNYAFLSSPQGQFIATRSSPKSPRIINGTGDLFSALYLGYFLLNNNALTAFQCALNKTHQVVQATQIAHCRELKIIHTDYKQVSPNYVMLRQIE
ncbi:pyridoxal kinase PdxY [Rickettsiella grylli]|uniref:pyridoxal kinase n=1 Tax=Rickettsiella grylli TaxID=59196 RepID=A8PP85_9COXI|nr:pyridoxal kinase PdxY [Rickettsiella grylli]EDP46186.1 pyridoxal kinase [Rickettsiella grylli]